MSLKHSLLGFLQYQPMTGYQLKKYFDQSVRHFWPASLSQMYPTLNDLQKEGFVHAERIIQENAPNAIRYWITDEGRAELERWLCEPMDPPTIRSSLLLKVYFGSFVEKDQIIASLRQQIEFASSRCEEFERSLQHVQQQHAGGSDFYRESAFWKATIEFGIQYQAFFVQWCQDTISKLENTEKGEL